MIIFPMYIDRMQAVHAFDALMLLESYLKSGGEKHSRVIHPRSVQGVFCYDVDVYHVTVRFAVDAPHRFTYVSEYPRGES